MVSSVVTNEEIRLIFALFGVAAMDFSNQLRVKIANIAPYIGHFRVKLWHGQDDTVPPFESPVADWKRMNLLRLHGARALCGD
jgi:hypothetical protein